MLIKMVVIIQSTQQRMHRIYNLKYEAWFTLDLVWYLQL